MRTKASTSNKRWLMSLLLGVVLSAGAATAADKAPRVFVLGVDGLDPKLLDQFVAAGDLPNFARLIEQGDYKPLQTSMPPLSPVAWSNFITGMDPGGHGIFDFIHRYPDTILPYMSMSRATPPDKTIEFKSWVIPLSSGDVVNLRQGRAFWEYLEDHDVPTTIYHMPVNFPPIESGGKALSGMGTPDILGTPGTFSFYTSREVPNARQITGGEVFYVDIEDNTVVAELRGPENSLRRVPRKTRSRSKEVQYENPDMKVEFQVHIDPEEELVKIDVQGHAIVLREGEWSDWFRVDFVAVPLVSSVSAIGRFYLKQVRPDFELYLTPLQINPEDPAMPISTPESWSHDLYEALGHFYTQELPEDTKALTYDVFTGKEFWDQSQFVYGEQSRALDYFLSQFDEGFMFFYFSSVDQGSHMLWRYADPDHPGYVEDDQLLSGIRVLYREMDNALGRVMESIDDETTLIVMSDHGFCPFYRGVNLNTWLLEKGYVTLKDPSKQGRYSIPFANVDWSKTTAYALGLNGLYVNLEGREERGIVKPGKEHQELLDRLEQDLLAMRDPQNDEPVVTLVVRTERDFHGPELTVGPDIIVGYNWGYRSSWTSPLGEFPVGVYVDNDDAWSGDHSVDYRHVPGVLLSNRRITLDQPALYDLSVAILDHYGIDKPSQMIGDDCLGEPVTRGQVGAAAAQ
jgi:predicted AlkP superfamily phosphohydrolase/phosphomutase